MPPFLSLSDDGGDSSTYRRTSWRTTLKAARNRKQAAARTGAAFFMPGHRRTEEARPHGRGDAPHGADKETNMENENEPDEQRGAEGAPDATDWKAEARKWERRSKENAEKAKAELDALKAEKARANLVAKVAKETGVPASLITGDDEDSMREYAKRLAEWRKPKGAPKVGNAGSFDRGDGSKGGDDGRRVLARKMFGSDE